MKKYLITGLLLAAIVLVPTVSQASTLSDLTARLSGLIAQVQTLLVAQVGGQSGGSAPRVSGVSVNSGAGTPALAANAIWPSGASKTINWAYQNFSSTNRNVSLSICHPDDYGCSLFGAAEANIASGSGSTDSGQISIARSFGAQLCSRLKVSNFNQDFLNTFKVSGSNFYTRLKICPVTSSGAPIAGAVCGYSNVLKVGESDGTACIVPAPVAAQAAARSAALATFNQLKASKAITTTPNIFVVATKPGNPTAITSANTNEELIVTWVADGPSNTSSVVCRRKVTSTNANTSNVRILGSDNAYTQTYNGPGETGYADVTLFMNQTNSGTSYLKIQTPGTYTFSLTCAENTAIQYSANTTVTVTSSTVTENINSQISLAAPTVATVNLTQGQAITPIYYNVKNTGNVPLSSSNFRVRVTRSYTGGGSQGSATSDITAVSESLTVNATRGVLTYQPITPSSGTTNYVVKLQGLKKNTDGSWALVGNEVSVTYTIAPASTAVNQGTITFISTDALYSSADQSYRVNAGQSYVVNYRLTNTGTSAWAANSMKAVLTTPGSVARENIVTSSLAAGSSTNGQFSLTTTSAGTRNHQLYLYRKSGTTWAPISNPINIKVTITALVENAAVAFINPADNAQFQSDNIITVTGQLTNTSTGGITLQPNNYKIKLDVHTGTLTTSQVVYTNTSNPISNSLTVGQSASKTFSFYSASFSPTATTRTYYLRLTVLRKGTDGEYRSIYSTAIRPIRVVAAPTLSQVVIQGNPATVVRGTRLGRITWQTTGSVSAVDVYVCIQGGSCLKAYQSLSNVGIANDVLVADNVPAGSTAYVEIRKAGESSGTSVKGDSNTFTVTAPLTDNASFSALSIVSTSDNTLIHSGTTLKPLFVGEQARVSFNARNTGNTTWVAGGANPYSLGSQAPRDNSTWGALRYRLPGSVGKTPGQDWVGSFTITAPSTLGTYNFQWQMLQEGVRWFGPMLPASPLAVRVIARPSVSISGIASGWISGEAKTVSWNKLSFDSADQVLARLCQIVNNQPISSSCFNLKNSNNSVILTNDGSESVTIPSGQVIGNTGQVYRLYVIKNGDGAYRGNGESAIFTVLPVPAPTIIDRVDFNRALAQIYFNYWEAENYQGKKDYVSCEIKAWSNRVTGVKTRSNLDAKNNLPATGKNIELCNAVGSCPRIRGYFTCKDSRSNAQTITVFGRDCVSTAGYPNDPALISANSNCGTDL